VTYDISLAPPRLQHMPPAALALAILLHVLIGGAIWWIAPLQPAEPEDPPIMVMFDSTPSNVGLQAPDKAGPPAESAAASPQPSTEPQREERQQQALAPPLPSTAPPQPAPPSEAKPQPEPVPTLPIFEFSVPPAPEPLPAPTSRDFAKPPVSHPPPRPVQRTQPLSPRPAPPAPQRPPADMPATMPSPMPGPDPGDVLIGQGRQRNDYLSRVARQVAQYRVYPASALANNQGGRVVMRVTVARNGQVLDVGVRTSSGWPAIDAAEVETIRKAAPFPPLPSEMPGDPVVLVLPVTYSPSGSRGR
jgi:periplasmic protein TonB